MYGCEKLCVCGVGGETQYCIKSSRTGIISNICVFTLRERLIGQLLEQLFENLPFGSSLLSLFVPNKNIIEAHLCVYVCVGLYASIYTYVCIAIHSCLCSRQIFPQLGPACEILPL